MKTISSELNLLFEFCETHDMGLLAVDSSGAILEINKAFQAQAEGRGIEGVMGKSELSQWMRDPQMNPRLILENEDVKITRFQISNHPDVFFFSMQKNSAFAVHAANEARLADMGQMASGIAHEINNPLTVVLSKLFSLEKVISRDEPSEKQAQLLDSVTKARNSIYKITKIVKGLKNLARPPQDDDLEMICLKDVLMEVIELSSERFKDNGIIFKHQILDDAMVMGRSTQISQVVINLLNNAFDAISDLDMKRIELQVVLDAGMYVIRVFDNGPGVPAGIENKIMNPFFTTKKVGQGTGLGLSLSKKIAQNHKGDLVLNRAISDSCFEFRLPAETIRRAESA